MNEAKTSYLVRYTLPADRIEYYQWHTWGFPHNDYDSAQKALQNVVAKPYLLAGTFWEIVAVTQLVQVQR